MTRVGPDQSAIAVLIHALHARRGAHREEIAQVIPIVGRPIGEGERHLVTGSAQRRPAALAAQLPRRPAIGVAEGIVEPAEAPEPGGERNLRHRQIALIDQPLREMQPARLGDRQRRSADMLQEEPIEVPRANTDTRGELPDTDLIERAFVDEAQRPSHDRGGAEPRRRAWGRLRAATQAWPEARLGRRRRGTEIAHVAPPGGRRGRTDGTAINARRSHGDEELAVEARVAAQPRPLQHRRIEWQCLLHGYDDTPCRRRGLAIFGRG